MITPFLEIPLEIYEKHLSLDLVEVYSFGL